MYNNNFKRVEKKYILTEQEKNDFFQKIGPYIEADIYFNSDISNIYFDTENNDLIINSIEKPLFKGKIRLRSYCIPNDNTTVFLEFKSKYKDMVGKRRVPMTLREFYDFFHKRKYDTDNQIMKEIAYYFDYYKLSPKELVAYNRLSYRGIEDNNLRITVDSDLRSRKNKLKLELGNQGNLYFDEPCYIVEIKALNAMPLWLTSSLSELKIYPRGFSKYGSIYKKESDVKC